MQCEHDVLFVKTGKGYNGVNITDSGLVKDGFVRSVALKYRCFGEKVAEFLTAAAASLDDSDLDAGFDEQICQIVGAGSASDYEGTLDRSGIETDRS